MGERCKNRTEGFTLVELMLLVVVLGILVLIAVASYDFTVQRSYRIACLGNQRTLSGALETYASANGDYPSLLVDLAPYTGTWSRCCRCPETQRVLEYDSEAHLVTCDSHVALK